MKQLFGFFKKLFAITLVLVTVLCSVEMTAFAFEKDSFNFEETYVNQLYYSANAEETEAKELSGSFITGVRYTGVNDEQAKRAAAIKIRDYMIARKDTFSINVKTTRQDYTALVKEMFNLAISMELADSPVAGDYLAWQYGGYSYSGSASVEDGYIDYTFNFNIPYYTTAAQEQKVTAAVKAAITEMKLDNLTTYEKIKKVYDYVCKVCNYEKAATANHYTRFSAYGAIIEHKAVCQGYTMLLYRMLKEIGVNNKVVTSKDHSWNIIELDGKYYNADATWDDNYYDNGYNYMYFLKCANHFKDHYRENEYKTAAFNNTYVMTLECYQGTNQVKTKATNTACSNTEPVAETKVTVGTVNLGSVKAIANGFTAAWTKLAGVDGYQLQYSKDNKFSVSTTINITTANTVSRKVTGAAANTKYFVRIRAYKKSNGADVYGKWSAIKNVTTPAKPKTVKLNSVTAASKAFTVKWTKVAGVTGYQVQYSVKSNFSGATTVKVNSDKTTSKKIAKATAKKKYFVRVRAYKVVNGTYIYGGWSTVKNVVVKK